MYLQKALSPQRMQAPIDKCCCRVELLVGTVSETEYRKCQGFKQVRQTAVFGLAPEPVYKLQRRIRRFAVPVRWLQENGQGLVVSGELIFRILWIHVLKVRSPHTHGFTVSVVDFLLYLSSKALRGSCLCSKINYDVYFHVSGRAFVCVSDALQAPFANSSPSPDATDPQYRKGDRRNNEDAKGKRSKNPESHLLEKVRGRFARALSRCAKDEGIQVICRGDVCSCLINLPFIRKGRVFAHMRTNTHSCTLAGKFSRVFWSAQNKTLNLISVAREPGSIQINK